MIRMNCCSCRNRIAASECGLDPAAVCTGAMRIELSDGISAEAHGRSVGRRRALSQRSRLFGETQRQPLDGQNPCHVLRQHVAHRWQIDHLFQRGKKKKSSLFLFAKSSSCGEDTQRKMLLVASLYRSTSSWEPSSSNRTMMRILKARDLMAIHHLLVK